MTGNAHAIRLRAPWESLGGMAPTSAAVGVGDAGSNDAVSSDSKLAQLGCRYRRWFGRPTGLDAAHRVWLVVELDAAAQQTSCEYLTAVEMNGVLLAAEQPAAEYRWDITARLAPRNEVIITSTSEPTDGARPAASDATPTRGDLPRWIREVRLEIHVHTSGTSA